MKYYGFYKGVVEDNNDPENVGRIRVRIENIDIPFEDGEGTQTSDLHWCQPLMTTGGDEGNIDLYVPAIGTPVLIGFLGGEREYPVVLGYWRKKGFPILQNYENIKGTNNKHFFIKKTGDGDNAPTLSMNGSNNLFSISSNENTLNIGGNYGTQIVSSESNSLLLKKNGIELSYKNNKMSSSLYLTQDGINIKTNASKNEHIKNSRTVLIGESIINNFIDLDLKKYGFSENSIFEGTNGDEFFGKNLYSKIINTLNDILYSSSHSLYKNIYDLTSTHKDIEDFMSSLEEIPSKNKNIVFNILFSNGESNFFLNLFKNKLPQTLNAIKNESYKNVFEEELADNLVVNGGKQDFIFGELNQKVSQDTNLSIGGTEKKIVFKDKQWQVLGKINGLVVGDYNISNSTSGYVFDLTNPFKKFTVKPTLPLSKPSKLVKQSAYNDLVNWVFAISQQVLLHQHLGNFGAPTLPNPVDFTTFLTKKTINELKIKVLQNIPAPINTYFTNNMEVS